MCVNYKLLYSVVVILLTSTVTAEEESSSSPKNHHKRGLYSAGYGWPQYAEVYNYPKWAAHSYAIGSPVPALPKPVWPAPSVLTPGGASVTSYSATYPQYPYYVQKPVVAVAPVAPVAPVGPVAPAVSQAVIPVQYPQFIQKPVYSIAQSIPVQTPAVVPSHSFQIPVNQIYPSVQYVNRIPVYPVNNIYNLQKVPVNVPSVIPPVPAGASVLPTGAIPVNYYPSYQVANKVPVNVNIPSVIPPNPINSAIFPTGLVPVNHVLTSGSKVPINIPSNIPSYVITSSGTLIPTNIPASGSEGSDVQSSGRPGINTILTTTGNRIPNNNVPVGGVPVSSGRPSNPNIPVFVGHIPVNFPSNTGGSITPVFTSTGNRIPVNIPSTPGTTPIPFPPNIPVTPASSFGQPQGEAEGSQHHIPTSSGSFGFNYPIQPTNNPNHPQNFPGNSGGSFGFNHGQSSGGSINPTVINNGYNPQSVNTGSSARPSVEKIPNQEPWRPINPTNSGEDYTERPSITLIPPYGQSGGRFNQNGRSQYHQNGGYV